MRRSFSSGAGGWLVRGGGDGGLGIQRPLLPAPGGGKGGGAVTLRWGLPPPVRQGGGRAAADDSGDPRGARRGTTYGVG